MPPNCEGFAIRFGSLDRGIFFDLITNSTQIAEHDGMLANPIESEVAFTKLQDDQVAAVDV